MRTILRLRIWLGCLWMVLSVGCVTVERPDLPEHWPRVVGKPLATTFAGEYSAVPADVAGSHIRVSDKHLNLEAFLTGNADFKATSCKIVENGGTLAVTSRDDSGKSLKSTVRPAARGGRLHIRNYSAPVRDALAYGFSNRRHYLYSAEDGSLIGLRETTGTGFVIGVIPAAGTTRDWVLWKPAHRRAAGTDSIRPLPPKR